MKKKIFLITSLTMILAILFTTAVFAASAEPKGSCPPGFTLHEFEDHSSHPEHHIGIKRDINGDGFVCVKHINENLHVHVDNNLPLR